MILPAELLSESPDLSPTGFPLFVFELPVLLHFPLVSCLIVYSCSIRKASINKQRWGKFSHRNFLNASRCDLL